MKGEYMGTLSADDALYDFLKNTVLDETLNFKGCRPVFDVYRLNNSGTVYGYADRRTFVRLVGKFYGSRWLPEEHTADSDLRTALMEREVRNLQQLRALGMDAYPHLVVKPLATCQAINHVLVESFAPGPDLNVFIQAAIHYGKGDELQARLTDVAWFLADMHNRSQTQIPVDTRHSLGYLDTVIDQLASWSLVSYEQRQHLQELRRRWQAAGVLDPGRQVLIHGDPMPTHFLFNGEHEVALVDLEWLCHADRAADLGCMAAELKHLFWFYSGDPWAGEPYIQHFYAVYASYLPEGVEDFASLTERGRFFMGCFALRTGRNEWLDWAYRQRLIADAIECLNI